MKAIAKKKKPFKYNSDNDSYNRDHNNLDI